MEKVTGCVGEVFWALSKLREKISLLIVALISSAN